MRTTREILRLRLDLGRSHREISLACKKSPSTVGDCLMRFRASKLPWPLPEELDDNQLEKKLYPPAPPSGDKERPEPDWEHIERQLKSKNVTLELLWGDYQRDHAKESPYQYTWFCNQFRAWQKQTAVTMRQSHKLGEKMFVDWAGTKVPIINAVTGEVTEASVFVATLGASSYTYAEAFENEKIPSWIAGHNRACAYFGGVPEVVVPDNPKTGVTKADYYEPDINLTYQAWADHNEIAVLPARPRKPQDKAKVESAVKVTSMWILARIRNMTFFSVNELNAVIWELLEELNASPFQKRPGSRKQCFEEQEKATLRPLPVDAFEIFECKKARVAPDYHVEVEGHYYSVPFTLVKEMVEVRIRPGLVQAFHGNRLVATHRRSRYPGQHTTNPEHMPPHHRHQVEWTPERFQNWALRSGPAVREFVTELLERRRHPEQAYRSCFGLMKLGEQYSSGRLNDACLRALALGAYQYKSVKSILERGLDKEPLHENPPARTAGHHENVRGAAYYGQLDFFSDN